MSLAEAPTVDLGMLGLGFDETASLDLPSVDGDDEDETERDRQVIFLDEIVGEIISLTQDATSWVSAGVTNIAEQLIPDCEAYINISPHALNDRGRLLMHLEVGLEDGPATDCLLAILRGTFQIGDDFFRTLQDLGVLGDEPQQVQRTLYEWKDLVEVQS